MMEQRFSGHIKTVVLAFAVVMALALMLLSGCSGNSANSNASNTAVSPSQSSSSSGSEEYPAIDMAAMNFDYSKRDLDPSYDEATATKIKLADARIQVEGEGANASGSTVTITAEGTYIISGELNDGQVVVDATSQDKIQLVLAGVSIHNNDGPAIYIKQADKCFITLATNTQNSLSDSSSYTLETGEDEPNATLFSKDDLTINGEGSLQVDGNYRHAVNSKDDLAITGGNFVVNSVEDALRGKDCVKINAGTFRLTSGEDAIKSNNDNAADRGYVCIDGGTFTINAGDDAVHAETVLMINDGDINIVSCYEGYEAEQIYINGAVSDITASDDAINASARGASSNDFGLGGRGGNMDMQGGQQNGTSGATPQGQASPCLLQINGGFTTVNAGGDGLDSNGSLEISGGVVMVSGPMNSGNGILDFDQSGSLTGGTILFTGLPGMLENFNSIQQPMIMANVQGQARQSVSIVDAQGKVLASYTAPKSFQVVMASSSQLQEGTTYRVVVGGTVSGGNEWGEGGSISGGTSVDAVASKTQTSMGQGMNGGGMRGGAGSGAMGSAPEGSDPSTMGNPGEMGDQGFRGGKGGMRG